VNHSKLFSKRFARFAFSPSIGASGGIIVLWNSSIFTGTILKIHNCHQNTIFLHI
jgi:hypothetical protein